MRYNNIVLCIAQYKIKHISLYKKGDITGELALFDVPFGQIRCPAGESLPGTQKSLVLVRPESLKVFQDAPPNHENTWLGEIEEKTFLGDFIDCLVSVDGFVLRAKLDPYTQVSERDKVYVTIDPQRCAVIALTDPNLPGAQ